MSIHGECFDNCDSGKCNVEDCGQFLDGNCDVAQDVFEACLEGMHPEYEMEIYDIYPELKELNLKKEIEMSKKLDEINIQWNDRAEAAKKLRGMVESLTKVSSKPDATFYDGNEEEIFCETVNVPVKVVCLENNGKRKVFVNSIGTDLSVLTVLVSKPLINTLLDLENTVSKIDADLGCENLDKMVTKALR